MPRCADHACGRWRPERLTPRWPIGVRLNGAWYCSAACVHAAARQGMAAGPRYVPPAGASLTRTRLGALLRKMRVIDDAQLQDALHRQRQSGRRLGAELEQLGHAGRDAVLRALATQHGVKYLLTHETRRLLRPLPWLPPDMARALEIAPFGTDEGTRLVKVICAAPVPRAALRALRTLTGWTPDVYLVADAVWRRALDDYAGLFDMPAALPIAAGVEEAASVVASRASDDRSVTMRLARWERYAWVRVEGQSRVSDVLIPQSMEDACQAAPTAH
jgi:hypothetical protein